MATPPAGDPARAPWSRLGRWPGRRVLRVSIAWLLLMVVATLARVALAARAHQRANPDSDSFLLAVGTPGGFPAVLGPPFVLWLAWRWARRRTPHDRG